jgi:hypothetical protein
MTASLSGTAPHVVAVGPGPAGPLPQSEVHAVAKPVVDGLELSVCGLLVSAIAARDWPTRSGGPRCAECARIAG